ncbi:hypothetical protein C7M84_010962 [Penaeus vannamei]|uniref:Uncharacterized protein n=1 Tax=Penaeus vannamei TaxID=6689 RepID=A0A3R7QKX9_PENVA|nr:hypothetical protein C7M84_010962 [Penaeus vannamei]
MTDVYRSHTRPSPFLPQVCFKERRQSANPLTPLFPTPSSHQDKLCCPLTQISQRVLLGPYDALTPFPPYHRTRYLYPYPPILPPYSLQPPPPLFPHLPHPPPCTAGCRLASQGATFRSDSLKADANFYEVHTSVLVQLRIPWIADFSVRLGDPRQESPARACTSHIFLTYLTILHVSVLYTSFFLLFLTFFLSVLPCFFRSSVAPPLSSSSLPFPHLFLLSLLLLSVLSFSPPSFLLHRSPSAPLLPPSCYSSSFLYLLSIPIFLSSSPSLLLSLLPLILFPSSCLSSSPLLVLSSSPLLSHHLPCPSLIISGLSLLILSLLISLFSLILSSPLSLSLIIVRTLSILIPLSLSLVLSLSSPPSPPLSIPHSHSSLNHSLPLPLSPSSPTSPPSLSFLSPSLLPYRQFPTQPSLWTYSLGGPSQR